MCSNKNNNRVHQLSHYVVEVNGVMVDRRSVAGLPKPTTTVPAEQPVKAAAPLAGTALPAKAAAVAPAPIAPASTKADAPFPLAGAVVPAEAAAIALAAIAPAPIADRPRTYDPIPAFDARPTIAAQRRAILGQAARENKAAIKADRAVRRRRLHQVRKLRSYKAARETGAALALLPRVARSDAEGLAAAKQLTAALAPRQIFSQESLMNKCRQFGHNPRAYDLVKANIWRHSTMMTTVDLRDDEARSYDGNPLRRGAIYEPETALSCRKLNLQIYVEMASCAKRAIDEFRRIADYCPRLQSMRVECIGENLQAAREVAQALVADFESGESGFADELVIEWDASEYVD